MGPTDAPSCLRFACHKEPPGLVVRVLFDKIILTADDFKVGLTKFLFDVVSRNLVATVVRAANAGRVRLAVNRLRAFLPELVIDGRARQLTANP